MKDMKNIEDQLREKMPPMRTEFRAELRAELFQTAEQQFKKSSSFMFFTRLLHHMKRYSLAYLSLLVIAVFSLTSVFKTPLSAQEVLANTLENIENSQNSGDIYHEKVAYYSYDYDGKLVDSDMQEDYYGKNGNFLRLMKSIDSEELQSVHLEVRSSLGVIEMYDNAENVVMADSQSIAENHESEDQEWWGMNEKNKIYCVQNAENEEKIGKAFLMFSQDNPTLYQVGGSVDSRPSESNEAMDLNTMLDLKNADKKKDSVIYFIEKLAQDKRYDYSLIHENGRAYHLFKLPQEIIGDYVPNVYWFYIDAQTYDLNRYEEHAGEKLVFKKVILTSEYLDSSKYPNLFNPNRFQNLVSGIALEADPVAELIPDGCYDPEMNKIQDSIKKSITPEAQQEWDNIFQSIQEELRAPSSDEQEKNFVTFPYDPMPANGNITQLYRAGHYGWDIAFHKDENIYSPKNGVVVGVQSEGFNGGYGKNVTIAHDVNGQKFETSYAHLSEIKVKTGEKVEAGQVIGKMGETGRANGKHLHFEVRLEGKKVDPALLWKP